MEHPKKLFANYLEKDFEIEIEQQVATGFSALKLTEAEEN